jgi:hypothetical protein
MSDLCSSACRPSDAGDVDDGGATGAFERLLLLQVRECGPGGVEGGEEVDLHGGLEGGGGHDLGGTDLDDGGVVDENVDAAEAGDCLGDEALALFGFGEVGGYEQEVIRSDVRVAAKKSGLRLLEFVDVARGEDEAGLVFFGEARGDGETEAARSACDEHDGAGRQLSRVENSREAEAESKDGEDEDGEFEGVEQGVHAVSFSSPRLHWAAERDMLLVNRYETKWRRSENPRART